MLEKGKPEPVLTFYSYDIHGNVRSLLQQLPGLGHLPQEEDPRATLLPLREFLARPGRAPAGQPS